MAELRLHVNELEIFSISVGWLSRMPSPKRVRLIDVAVGR